MELRHLRLVNFRQHEDTALELGDGLTGIIGTNGAGKTTLLEAIAWALYGMPAARGNRDSIRRIGAPARSRVEVQLEFVVGPDRYRVTRTLADASLHRNDDGDPIATSLAGVTDQVTRLLGMTRDEFFTTYFTAQKDLAVMGSLSATERAQFLSRMLGYERLRGAQDLLRDQRSQLRARLAGLEEHLPDVDRLQAEAVAAAQRHAELSQIVRADQTRRDEVAQDLDRLSPEWAALQQQREDVQRCQQEVVAAEHRAVDMASTVERVAGEVAESAAAAAQRDALTAEIAPLAALRAERDHWDQLAALAVSRREAQGQIAEVRRTIEALTARLEQLPKADQVEACAAEHARARARLAEATTQHATMQAAWLRESQDAATRRQQLLDQFATLRSQRDRLVGLGPDGACPTCARSLGQEYDAVIAEFERQLSDIEGRGRELRARVDQFKDPPAELQAADEDVRAATSLAESLATRLATLRAQAQERDAVERRQDELHRHAVALELAYTHQGVTYDPDRHAEVRRQIAALEPLARESDRLAVLADRLDALRERDRQARQALLAVADTVTVRRAALDAIGWSDARYQDVENRHSALVSTLRELDVGLARSETECTAARVRETELLERLAEAQALQSRVASCRREAAVLEHLSTALRQLRDELNAAVRPELSDLASTFLQILTDGRYDTMVLTDAYEALIVDAGEPKAVISGGEEDVASIALRLAISQMIADRSGQPLALLVLDEVFGSLDEGRRAAVVDLLRNLAGRFPQILLITHIDTANMGFDRVVRVEYDAARGIARATRDPLEDVA